MHVRAVYSVAILQMNTLIDTSHVFALCVLLSFSGFFKHGLIAKSELRLRAEGNAVTSFQLFVFWYQQHTAQ